MLGEPLDAERLRLRAFEAIPALGLLVRCGHDVLAGAKAVVEDDLGLAVAVGIEAAADVRERVPLRRVLQRHERDVVAYDVGESGAVLAQRKAEVLLALALAAIAQRGGDARRVAPRIERVAAGIVERQRAAEGDALLHLRDALQHLLARHPVHAPALIVGAELAPVGARRPLLPALAHKPTPRSRARFPPWHGGGRWTASSSVDQAIRQRAPASALPRVR